MKYSHEFDESFVLFDISMDFRDGLTLNVLDLAKKYDYTTRSIYRLIRKINEYLIIRGDDYRLAKIDKYTFKKQKVESEENL